MSEDQIKELVIQEVKKEKPETTKQLIALIQQHLSLPPKQTTNLLIELEKEDRLHFKRQKKVKQLSGREYICSKQATWYWTTIFLAIVTTIAVFIITGNGFPLVYLRYLLGIIFVLFLPGFTLIKALFPEKIPLKNSSENSDIVERVALSIGMSLMLVPMVGLILNYTVWGIRLTPITLTLLALTAVFATVAILRDYQIKLNSTQAK